MDLKTAIIQGNLSRVQEIFNRNPDIDKNEYLVQAAEHGHLEIVEELLDHITDLEQQGESALIQAAKNGHLMIVRKLFNRGVNLDSDSEALTVAIANHHLDVIKLILKRIH